MALPSKELSEQALDALVTRERTRVVAPLTDWRSLSMSLRQEGLLHDTGARAEPAPAFVPPREGSGWMRTTGRWTMRIAAGAVLVGAGVIAGRGMTIGQDLVNSIHLAMSDSTSGGTTLRVANTPFQSSGDARKTMLRAQTDYERASAFLAATDSSPRIIGDPETYRDRLTGLDDLTNASLAALKESPQDAMLNSFYLSASAAREATLQRLAHSLPADERMVRF
ncbi:MAG: hypothetical protein M3Z30_10165 [Gemmatimonadota bacterium]|nr:hypothetical protein [Gemmatimonadota bacterium]